ncbi:hypothetical protein EOPP23_11140 [Endozoicomonas sp. OPT23]|uniref:flavin reductase family protein n=1 Tax=Endozoicomonas sp. OPT23 TaxID=2072845 RepID=UPI00129A801D|nr:flavin reductase family protein [Endozoicomonas sp. OPT23]MRI33540.1 hypothetical protein [Endozoicomonas sp. OPT23]
MSNCPLTNDFKSAMQELAASVNVISTAHDGVRNGLTATAVCSLSMEPASMLVCINKNVQALEQIKASGSFCINILAADQQQVSDVFAGRSGATADQRFTEAGEWTTSEAGSPMLDGALANVVCEVSELKEAGSHFICIGYVKEVRLGAESTPLIYAQQSYATVANLPDASAA